MTRDAVIATLRANEAALRLRGVAHAALFGSVARGQAGPHSDIDIMVEIDPAAEVDLYDYGGVGPAPAPPSRPTPGAAEAADCPVRVDPKGFRLPILTR